MPKIVDPNGKGAVSTALGAGYYRLIGLEVTVAPAVNRVWALVNLGNGGREQSSLDVVAHHLILDRMYIHGDPQHDCFRCVALNSASSAVIDSYLSEGHVVGFDAQAICCVNGPGPFKIVNNYGSSQKNCNTIEVTHGKEKGTDPFCAQHPAGRSGKRGLSPFPLRKILRMLQFS